MTKRTSIVSSMAAVLMLGGLAVIAPTSAEAGQIRFGSIHPIPGAVEGDFCYIEFPHVHVYEPDQQAVLYREHDDYHYFVGDPIAHGYDGPRHNYYGHHPIAIDTSIVVEVNQPVVDYCYLNGPHFHGYAPPPQFTFALKGDAHWFIGKYPKDYHKHKKRLVAINAVYEPIVYERPVVVFDAPPVGYVGPVVVVNAPVVEVVTPVVEVRRPRIEVEIPVPSIDIHVGGGVLIDHHHHGKHKKHKRHKKHRRRGWGH